MMANIWFPLAAFLLLITMARAQDQQNCMANQIFNGKSCECAPGYFDKNHKDLCEDECEEDYFSFFTYGTCASGLFSRTTDRDRMSPCNMKCGVRLYLWASVGIFAVFAAAVVTLVLLLPICIANCMSCVYSKKASKHSKQVVMEQQQQQQPSKDQQQMATMSYNPYTYWPYYGR